MNKYSAVNTFYNPHKKNQSHILRHVKQKKSNYNGYYCGRLYICGDFMMRFFASLYDISFIKCFINVHYVYFQFFLICHINYDTCITQKQTSRYCIHYNREYANDCYEINFCLINIKTVLTINNRYLYTKKQKKIK